MSNAYTRYFDFSLDAQQFKEHLAKELQNARVANVVPIDDEDLEHVNAAGVPYIAPKDEEHL